MRKNGCQPTLTILLNNQRAYKPRSARTSNRSPKLLASSVRAICSLVQSRIIQPSNGTKQVVTSRLVRLFPALSLASKHHSYKRCSRLASGSLSSKAKNVATVVRPHERVQAMPKLHSARTVACGLVRCGMLLDTQSVHCDNPSWRAISLLWRVWVSKHLHTTSSWPGSSLFSKNLPPKGAGGEGGRPEIYSRDRGSSASRMPSPI